MKEKYIRFGNLPESGKSRNSMNSSFESGISCYRAIRCEDGWRLDGAWGSYRMLAASGRTLYELSGTVLDEKGSDGEPLIAGAKIVRRSKIAIVGDMWDRVECSSVGAAEAIWKHRLSGNFWVSLSGILEQIEFRCEASDFARQLKIMLPSRADKILADIGA